ncbi:RnaseH [Senna tora]|uniref:RnaseH (Mitochondrion) n=1 Tax=Senna tora TaxID=362788 RepID=A0A834XDQ0_9FABA|nr:RnaseH [Senna tora]
MLEGNLNSIPMFFPATKCGNGMEVSIPASFSACKLHTKRNLKVYLHESTNNLAMSCDGVARDWYGNWLYGYSKSLGNGCSAYAELWSIYFGLSTAWDRGYKKVILELDSSFVIQLIQDVSFTAYPLKRLILSIRDFLNKDWQVELNHTLREENYVAYSLAVHHAHSLPYGFKFV